MAKKDKRIIITLVSKNEDGKITYSYQTEKSKVNTKDKLELRKYNPKTKQHELFIEKK